MPQVFQVLCCYNCSMFQVHQIKKANKWQCKVCNEKQSHKKAFKIGFATECRSLVQELNMKTSKMVNQNIDMITTKISSQDKNQTLTCEEVYVHNKRNDDNENSHKFPEIDCKDKSIFEVSDKNTLKEANDKMHLRNLQYPQTELSIPKSDCILDSRLSEVSAENLKSFDLNNFGKSQKRSLETEFDVPYHPLVVPFAKKNRGFEIIKNAASKLT